MNFDFSVYRCVSLNKSFSYSHMHGLLLGICGVFFGARFFLGALLWQQPNKGLVCSFLGCIARQQPISNNREVLSLGSIPKTCYHGKMVLLV
jgi:hypothetical protein